MSSEKVDYSVAQKVIHWLMAFLIRMDLFIAQDRSTAKMLRFWKREQGTAD